MTVSAHNHLGMARDELRGAESAVRKAGRRPDPLAAVPLIQAAIAHLEEAREQMVLEARHQDRSWEVIASEFGITRQAAYQRFGDAEH